MIGLRSAMFALAMSCLCLSPFAHASDAIGFVRVLKGEAYQSDHGKVVQLTPNMAVGQGTQITTHAGASVGIIFKDNTVIALGPDSVFSIQNYAYSPEQAAYAFGATLNKGTLAYSSGAIAERNPMGVTLKTPNGDVSVRGNQFAVKVDE